MPNRLVIIGAGGHGKVVADIALKNGYQDIVFLDDGKIENCMGFPVVGTSNDINRMDDGKTDFVIAVGNNKIRRKIAEMHPVNWISLIHPSACLGFGSKVGRGSVVMANAVINACATVGEHCIVNTGAVVEHDNVLHDFVHISPNASLGGTVSVGTETHIGIGAIIKNNINICDTCTIGAGAVVVKDIKEYGIYVGVPARKIK